jgi:murein DD-endopeptidase MepM/ murein hydrolase activator NlpD
MFRIGLVAVAATLALAACGQPTTPQAHPRAAGARPASAAPAPPGVSASSTPPAAAFTYAFPVLGKTSYAHTHHDYPASDIMAPCGATAVAPVAGTVLEVNRVDTYDPKVNAGPTRGGLSVSILGDDGVRYYGSHFMSVDAGIEPGVRVTPGMPLAKIGKTGDASACHEHFGISPPCAKSGDWYNRRGLVWPWPYLDSWRSGGAKSPVAEVTAWRSKHGCPTKPLSDP